MSVEIQAHKCFTCPHKQQNGAPLAPDTFTDSGVAIRPTETAAGEETDKALGSSDLSNVNEGASASHRGAEHEEVGEWYNVSAKPRRSKRKSEEVSGSDVEWSETAGQHSYVEEFRGGFDMDETSL